MNIPYVFKVCTKCGKPKVANTKYFYKKKGGKFGLRSYCKICSQEYSKQWYQGNKEYFQEHSKQWYQDNKEHKQEYSKKYYQDNKEYIKQWYQDNKEYYQEYHKQYYQDNKEHKQEYSKKYSKTPQGQVVKFNSRCRRRAKEAALGNGITKEQYKECLNYFGWKCAYSGKPLNKGNRSLDHITPLNSGGENEIWNLVPMYIKYNSSKQDKEMIEWYKEQPFYSEDRLKKIYEWQEYAYNKYYEEVAYCTK